MSGIVNLQDTPGRTAGKRVPPDDSFQTGMDLQQLAVDLGRTLKQGLVPKGVYRFTSHQEADQWMWKMMARPRED